MGRLRHKLPILPVLPLDLTKALGQLGGLAEAQRRIEEEALAAIDVRLGSIGKEVGDARARFVAIGHRFEEVSGGSTRSDTTSAARSSRAARRP